MTNRQKFVQLGRKYSLSMAMERYMSIEGHQSAFCQVFGHHMLGTWGLTICGPLNLLPLFLLFLVIIHMCMAS
jgi:hypothetical protein